LRDFDLTDEYRYPPQKLPILPSCLLNKDQCPIDAETKKLMTKFPVRQLYGKLNWLMTMARPDIAVAMGYIGAYLDNPSMESWLAMIGITLYLSATKDIKMMFGRKHTNNPRLYAHTDASFAHVNDQYSSRSGGVLFYDNTVILQYTKKQVTVAQNTMEAELYAAREIINHIRFYIELLTNFGIIQQGPVDIYVDNIATLHFIEHPTGNKSRHLEAFVKLLRQLVDTGVLRFNFIVTAANLADFYTNIRALQPFITARQQLGLE
jgi:hypothetical protein